YQGAGTEANLTYIDQQGNIVQQPNANFQPKTQADIYARAGQIHTLMQQKGDEVQAKVGTMQNGKVYTADDALRDFNTWYGQQVTPQVQVLQGAQDQVAYDRNKDQMAARTTAQQAATSYGTGMSGAYKDWQDAQTRQALASPGFAQAAADLAKGKV